VAESQWRRIDRWVLIMSRKDILLLCFASTLPVGCALSGITADYQTGGSSGVGVGGKQTNAGGSRSQGGSANLGGTAAKAGSSSLGGTNANGGTSNTAGSNAAGGGTAVVGGTASTGGNSAATSLLGGASSQGGTANVGGSTGVGGVTSVGGHTAATGGAFAATGGTIATTSGTVATSGGSNATTGGTVATTGGASATTGGTVAVTGGTSATTGGAVAVTGGASATGGAPSTGGTSSAPVPTAVTTGWYHSCALMSDGTARCWGSECNGILGNGISDATCTNIYDGYYPPTNKLMQMQPVAVSGISDAIAIASGSGGFSTCVITASHQVKCWGDDNDGQLGDGLTLTFSSTPVATQGINNAVAISVGKFFSCAVLTDTTVQCWGSNSGRGSLGDGTTNDSAVPVTVVVSNNSPLTNAVSVSAGRSHACAVLKDKSVWCWGKGDKGQLGNGDTTVDPSAVAIQSKFTDAKTMGAGVDITCVLTSAGGISCVGDNESGELGNGTSTDSATAVTPQGLNTSITSLDVGAYHNCAVGTDSAGNTGSMQCWGWNQYGQLGIGNSTDSATPAGIKNPTGIVNVAASTWHTCAITSGNAIYCWGNGLEGQLGLGKAASSAIPQLVTGF